MLVLSSLLISIRYRSAEMHNQAINSLALISGRYTLAAVELASLMSASYIYTVCQALDLRVLQISFFQELEPALYAVSRQVFGQFLSYLDVDKLHHRVWESVQGTWLTTTNKDSEDRYDRVVDRTVGVIVQFLLATPEAATSSTSRSALTTITQWKISSRKAIAETFSSVRARFFEKQDTPDFLGLGSRKIYTYVRHVLGVPLHQGLKDHPGPNDIFATDGSRKRTIGSNIAIIYEALRSGELHEPLMDCLTDEIITTKSCRAVNGTSSTEHNGYINGTGHNRHTNGVATDETDHQDFLQSSTGFEASTIDGNVGGSLPNKPSVV